MHMLWFYFILLGIVFFASLYDLKHRKVSNWLTLPLILLGVFVSFPGNPSLWIVCVFIFSIWQAGVIGGGDAKLWMGLFWCSYMFANDRVFFVAAISWLITGAAQVCLRFVMRKGEVTGIKMPAAWRAAVYMGLLAYLV